MSDTRTGVYRHSGAANATDCETLKLVCFKNNPRLISNCPKSGFCPSGRSLAGRADRSESGIPGLVTVRMVLPRETADHARSANSGARCGQGRPTVVARRHDAFGQRLRGFQVPHAAKDL